ncbi:MAG: ribonuclease HI [Actinomycetaceae bacterium]|nr:ribonuclease HI [Actinomycetaceae bacterium]
MTIIAAADGSSLGNPGPSGWAWYVDETCWDAGGWETGTNNMGELEAIRQLLAATRKAGLSDEKLRIYLDSQYALNAATKWIHAWKKNGWLTAQKKPVANREIVEAIDQELQGRDIEFQWVRGHTGHALNEAADDAARRSALAYKEGKKPPAGPGFTFAAKMPDARAARADPPTNNAKTAETVETAATAVAAAVTEASGVEDCAPVAAAPSTGDSATSAQAQKWAVALITAFRDGQDWHQLLGAEFRLVSGYGQVLYEDDLRSGTPTGGAVPLTVGQVDPRVQISQIATLSLGGNYLTSFRVGGGGKQDLHSTIWDRQGRALFHQITPVIAGGTAAA